MAEELEIVLPARHQSSEAHLAHLALQIFIEGTRVAQQARSDLLAEILQAELGGEVVGLLERGQIDSRVLSEVGIKRGRAGLGRADDEEVGEPRWLVHASCERAASAA